MPRKNVLERYQAIAGGDMSGDITSPVTCIKFLDNVLIEFVASGSPVGEFKIEVSSDYETDGFGNVIVPGNWVALPLVPSASISAAGSIIVDMNQLPAPYIRARYVCASGSGSLDMFISAKEV